MNLFISILVLAASIFTLQVSSAQDGAGINSVNMNPGTSVPPSESGIRDGRSPRAAAPTPSDQGPALDLDPDSSGAMPTVTPHPSRKKVLKP